jgi:hypothetical protein
MSNDYDGDNGDNNNNNNNNDGSDNPENKDDPLRDTDVRCALCNQSWWHDHPSLVTTATTATPTPTTNNKEYVPCRIGRAQRTFIIPGDDTSWSSSQLLWMRCAGTS